eukprot:11099235-Lingulodinium_polyedra.AAC.1
MHCLGAKLLRGSSSLDGGALHGVWMLENSGLMKEAIKFIDVLKKHLQATGEKAFISMMDNIS